MKQTALAFITGLTLTATSATGEPVLSGGAAATMLP